MRGTVTLLTDPERVRLALSPLRLRLLDRLTTPASATQLAAEFELPRQRLSYHLRVLEDAGLVELVELRRRRGCTERIVRSTAASFVVDPDVLVAPDAAPLAERDHHAAEHLILAATTTVRDVARMQDAATRANQRLLTFTIEADVRFADPADVHRFGDALADAIARVGSEFDVPNGRSYRVTAGGYPTPRQPDGGPE